MCFCTSFGCASERARAQTRASERTSAQEHLFAIPSASQRSLFHLLHLLTLGAWSCMHHILEHACCTDASHTGACMHHARSMDAHLTLSAFRHQVSRFLAFGIYQHPTECSVMTMTNREFKSWDAGRSILKRRGCDCTNT